MEAGHWVTIVCAAIPTFGVIAASWIGYLGYKQSKGAHKESKETNDAVNHRHDKDTPRLYDLALLADARSKRNEERLKDIHGKDLKDIRVKVAVLRVNVRRIREHLKLPKPTEKDLCEEAD